MKSSVNHQDKKIQEKIIGENEIILPSGEIRINHSVIASIVRYSALEVEGVAQIGGRLIDGIAEIFSKRDSDRGVCVKEDESGNYAIDVRVFLYFGFSLTEVATQIQQNIAKQITFMTNKEVAQVNIIVDGIRAQDNKVAAKPCSLSDDLS
ncbi:MAG: Asp23/Gls24 family envelope stress response protein [Puniceicoccales bacterium]|jgi:uncharacterized alkaline shock family protein YloU|nr:Asp23/Gls24 family envelope stress response protein [Puniceicoccales bacterium]